MSSISAKQLAHENSILRKLHDELLLKLCERSEKDFRYGNGDFDPDTLRVTGALDNCDLPLMRAYAANYSRHSLRNIEGAFLALLDLNTNTGSETPLTDEHMIRHGAIRNAYSARRRKTNGPVYMEIDVRDVTRYVYEHPDDFAYVLEAVSRGHREIRHIVGVIDQMRFVTPGLIEGILLTVVNIIDALLVSRHER